MLIEMQGNRDWKKIPSSVPAVIGTIDMGHIGASKRQLLALS
jgi:hypothetical protein